jgi:hypothetical protein
MVERARNGAPGWCNFDLERTAAPEEIKANKDAPEQEFEIEHVYGYRAADCQQNLRYTAEGKALYMVAALGVVMDTATCQ